MPVTGNLDTVEDGRIVGWAWDRERPRGAVEVFLWIDGRLVDRALANRLRGDLARAGIADSRHGFAFACSIPAGTREIRVTTAAGTDLLQSPWRPQQPGRVLIPADHDRITILAIARNEGAYIEEWIAHHRAIGVDRFVIYDNASTDGTAERLRANAAIAGLVEVVDWPSSRHLPTEGPQLPAYADALPTLKRRGGWVAVIDIDELIVPLADHSLLALLARFRDVPALSLCWKVFGSSGHSDRHDDRLVTERFRFAGPSNIVKTIARAAAIDSISIHAPLLGVGQSVDELRRPIEARSTSRTATYRWGQINHYFGKSRAEWEAKRDRGRAGPAEGAENWRRPDDHFHAMDASSEYDLAIHRFRAGMLRTLTELFPERAERAARPARHAVPRNPAPTPALARFDIDFRRPSSERILGAIDDPPAAEGGSRRNGGRFRRFAGWLLAPDGRLPLRRLLRLRSDDPAMAGDYLLTIPATCPRPDVERLFSRLPSSVTVACGFDFLADLGALPKGRYRAGLGLSFPEGTTWHGGPERIIEIG